MPLVTREGDVRSSVIQELLEYEEHELFHLKVPCRVRSPELPLQVQDSERRGEEGAAIMTSEV